MNSYLSRVRRGVPVKLRSASLPARVTAFVLLSVIVAAVIANAAAAAAADGVVVVVAGLFASLNMLTSYSLRAWSSFAWSTRQLQ